MPEREVHVQESWSLWRHAACLGALIAVALVAGCGGNHHKPSPTWTVHYDYDSNVRLAKYFEQADKKCRARSTRSARERCRAGVVAFGEAVKVQHDDFVQAAAYKGGTYTYTYPAPPETP